MNLPQILMELDTGQITTREAVKLLAQHLDATELAMAFIQCRTQRNKWREEYFTQKEPTPWNPA